ncbi:MAG: glycoside hydrolase family 2 protein, partial [Lactobacillus sp.]|nr:glycoside hydrolase family 2 protein [Lactobacillus sp.]
MGVNALRSSHHFASKELLNACDRLGIILIDENRLLEATPWRLRNLTRMVKQSRSHVCISFWSIANEEIIGNTEYGRRSVKKITEIIRYLSPDTLLISAELLNPEGKVNDDYIKYFDILGVNYPEAGVMGEGAELIHQSHPNLPMMCTENASYFSTRGIYKDDAENCHTNNFGSLYSMVLPGKRKPGDPGVGGTARPETVMSYLHQHEYMGGVFLWTAFDYYGEPSPFGWPGISSQFGIMDLGGLPKDYFYYYQAQWQDQPVLHLMPSWNKTDLTIENGQTEVRVFSNLDEVELFINHKSLGKKAVKNYECNWQIKYEPGELLAKGYVKDKLALEDKKETSDKISKVNTAILYRGKNCT